VFIFTFRDKKIYVYRGKKKRKEKKLELIVFLYKGVSQYGVLKQHGEKNNWGRVV
jgi:hypothetical protein